MKCNALQCNKLKRRKMVLPRKTQITSWNALASASMMTMTINDLLLMSLSTSLIWTGEKMQLLLAKSDKDVEQNTIYCMIVRKFKTSAQ